jgi:hypothetical protein
VPITTDLYYVYQHCARKADTMHGAAYFYWVLDPKTARRVRRPEHTTDGNARSTRKKIIGIEVMAGTNVKSTCLVFNQSSLKYRPDISAAQGWEAERVDRKRDINDGHGHWPNMGVRPSSPLQLGNAEIETKALAVSPVASLRYTCIWSYRENRSRQRKFSNS